MENTIKLVLEIPGLLELLNLLKNERQLDTQSAVVVAAGQQTTGMSSFLLSEPSHTPPPPDYPTAAYPVGSVPATGSIYTPPASPGYLPQSPVTAPNVPAAAPTYTLDDLMRASCSLADAGKRQDVINLYDQFRIPALTALPKERYGEYAAALIGLGAKL